MSSLLSRVACVITVSLLACSSATSEQELEPVDADALRALCSDRSVGTMVRGIDVSKWQGDVDWLDVFSSGVSFAYARVSDGTDFVDPKFAENYNGIREHAMVPGAYQFFRPSEDALEQAKLFVKQINDAGGWKPGDMPPVIDVEVTKTTAKKLQTSMRIWIKYVQENLKAKPMIYTFPGMTNLFGGCFLDYPLWIADFGNDDCPRMPDAWADAGEQWTMWQYSERGSNPGIKGYVDLNVFNGNASELKAFLATVPMSDEQSKTVTLATNACTIR